ncbi:hypothetical protein C9374_012617 [Naegleria lovaniensis]|uniref:Uncharacterized protein n=1 Tax=Naegleria lovaniensis TaxID=51637 RepID=A0AA88KW73_NAELO|nr:uncharacterized protein C9374_012617 [Naegleria lovaniensis]KAG2392365.1 hypothetical protein C9374_012617 [Naegleria lovaniensis]
MYRSDSSDTSDAVSLSSLSHTDDDEEERNQNSDDDDENSYFEEEDDDEEDDLTWTKKRKLEDLLDPIFPQIKFVKPSHNVLENLSDDVFTHDLCSFLSLHDYINLRAVCHRFNNIIMNVYIQDKCTIFIKQPRNFSTTFSITSASSAFVNKLPEFHVKEYYCNLKDVKHLYCASLHEIHNLKHVPFTILTSLYLIKCNVDVLVMDVLSRAHFPHLNTLCLNNNYVRDECMSLITSNAYPSLQVLALVGNYITDCGVDEFVKSDMASQLTCLVLDENAITRKGFLLLLSSLPQVKVLSVADNEIEYHEKYNSTIGSQLTLLNISGNDMTWSNSKIVNKTKNQMSHHRQGFLNKKIYSLTKIEYFFVWSHQRLKAHLSFSNEVKYHYAKLLETKYPKPDKNNQHEYYPCEVNHYRKEIKKLYRQVAHNSERKAHYRLGMIYLAEKQIRKAVQHFEQTGLSFDMANYELGQIYFKGYKEVPQDYDKALKYFERCDDMYLWFEKGTIYYAQSRYKLAFDCLNALISEYEENELEEEYGSDAAFQVKQMLGEMFYHGLGCSRDRRKALHYLKDLSHEPSNQYLCAKIYEYLALRDLNLNENQSEEIVDSSSDTFSKQEYLQMAFQLLQQLSEKENFPKALHRLGKWYAKTRMIHPELFNMMAILKHEDQEDTSYSLKPSSSSLTSFEQTAIYYYKKSSACSYEKATASLGLLYHSLGLLSEARETLSQLRPSFTECSNAWYVLGQLLLEEEEQHRSSLQEELHSTNQYLYDQYLECFTRAASLGHLASMKMCGDILLRRGENRSVDKNSSFQTITSRTNQRKGAEWYELFLSSQPTPSQENTLSEGVSSAMDLSSAASSETTSTMSTIDVHIDIMFTLAKYYQQVQNINNAMKWYKKCIGKHPDAHKEYATLYFANQYKQNNQVNSENEECLEWLRIASQDARYPEATYYYALQRFPEHPQECLELLTLSKSRGFEVPQYKFGLTYLELNQHELAKPYCTIRDDCALIVREEFATAMLKHKLYEHSIKVVQSLSASDPYYMAILVRLYAEGLGVEHDENRVFELLGTGFINNTHDYYATSHFLEDLPCLSKPISTEMSLLFSECSTFSQEFSFYHNVGVMYLKHDMLGTGLQYFSQDSASSFPSRLMVILLNGNPSYATEVVLERYQLITTLIRIWQPISHKLPAAFWQFLQVAPKLKRNTFEIAKFFCKNQFHEEAQYWLCKVNEHDTDLFELALLWGNYDPQRELELYKKSKSYDALFNVATIYWAGNSSIPQNLDLSKVYYEKALAKAGDCDDEQKAKYECYYNLGALNYSTGHYERSLHYLQQAYSIDACPSCALYMALVYADTGLTLIATTLLDSKIGVRVTDDKIDKHELAALYFRLNREKEAALVLEQIGDEHSSKRLKEIKCNTFIPMLFQK